QTNMLFFIIVGQLIAAAIIDHFGLIGMTTRPIQIWQLIGFVFMGLGLVLFFFGKRLFG
uniref:DMT family transporter n=1 Tax=Avibacterium paragallinarum TaxID=728 RepID=UPI00300E6FFC